MKFYLDSILKGFKPVNSEVVLKGVSRQTPNFVIVDIDQDGMPEILFTYQFNGEKYIGILKRENMQWYLYDVSLEKDQKALGLGNLVNVLNGVNLTSEDVGKAVTMQDLVGNNDQAFVSYVNDILNHGMVMQQIAGEETVAHANEPIVQQVIQPALPSSTPLEEEPLVSAGGFIPSNTLNTSVSGTQTNVGGVANMPNNMNAGSMTGEQIIQQTGPLPPPENINTPQAQAALNQNVTTPIMSINEAGLSTNNNMQGNVGGQIMQQTGPLPPPGNVNMPQTQAAFGQNVTMPTMGINEAGLNANNMQGVITGEQIIQQTGTLPPPENINTPQAQAALNQNVTTPIMSINEAGLNANNMQGVMTGEQIIQQTGPLPSPGNVNTPQAQAALNQNFITPIMSTMGIGEQMDETAFEEEVAGGEMPEVKVYNISNDMGELGLNIASDKEVINFAQADVTGDGVPDNIYLVGNRPRPEMPGYFEDVGLRVVSDGRVYEIDFPYGNGYGPVLFVGDLTHDGIADILVNIFASGGGGFLTSYAYTFVNDQPSLLVDSKTFNDLQRGTVIYQDNYRVRIETLRPPRVYTIDISDRGPEYLNQIYNPDGTLIRPTEGTLLGLITLHTVDFDVNGEYNLSAVQRAIGLNNLDTLGLLETYFAWRPAISRFQPFAQYFSILGQPPR
ncbi:MAG: hypothetical protein ACLSH8_15485 [Zhenhengia sp.]|jgi:hypothetical protein|uniref:hypothetical protein n=1 Tax=Zhenhengia sp. TaxID=2944208 RepID=UPI00290903CC|nr:hypothetical protein [Clostridiales bacterium]MDU6974917.1 hypothetical protein [Clostridiales bacterium]